MRPPLIKRPFSVESLTPAQQPETTPKPADYADRVKLAEHLHNQGINPARWTEAHPAPAQTQKLFQETGRKARGNQFELGGRLYDWSPAVTATPAQARAVADAYVAQSKGATAASPASVESLVRVEDVQLKHPFGLPATKPAAGSKEAADFYLPFIRLGIDPVKTHLGDPLPMDLQVKVKQEMDRIEATGNAADSAGGTHLDHLYRGHDGWIYAKNAETQEDPAVQELRSKHAQERMRQSRDPSLPAANDNDAGLEGDILRFYAERDQATDATGRHAARHAALTRIEQQADKMSPTVTEQGQVPKGGWPRQGTGSKPTEPTEAEQNASAAEKLKTAATQIPAIIAVVKKVQGREALRLEEQALLDQVSQRFDKAGIKFDPLKADLNYLQETAKAIGHAAQSDQSRLPLHVIAAAINIDVAQALGGGTMALARLSQGGVAEAVRQSGALLTNARAGALIRGLAMTANAANNHRAANDRSTDAPDMLSLFADAAGDIVGEMVDEKTAVPVDRTNSTAATNLSVITSAEQGQRQRTFSPASPQTLKSLGNGLADATNIEIWIGGEPLFKQGEHKTLMDNIFRQEFIKVAQEKGCLPDPNDPKAKDKFKEYGGSESQKRITDTEQDGHLGSRQTDGAVSWENPDGSWTETHWNSTTPLANGFTETLREWRALLDIVVKIDKHLAMGGNMRDLLSLTKTPVLGKGPVYHMAEKRNWTEDELREFIRKKIRGRFDKDFKDCKFIGESRLVKLDDPNDPDLPRTPSR